ncbi:MAG: hypothetical protein IPN86_21055 [Saprospiraceae bacterium]|nr:hypothetical protein [Saprospiraceae bacterium]
MAGQFSNGKLNGSVVFNSKTEIPTQGQFVDGKMSGKGNIVEVNLRNGFPIFYGRV